MVDSIYRRYSSLTSKTFMRLVFLGPPGIGKGTQAKMFSKKFDIPHFSTGDILRSEIEQKSSLGLKAESIINSGHLVSDDIMLNIMEKRLQQDDVKTGYILDGFPRTILQAEGLDKINKRLQQRLDAVIALDGDEETTIKRISSRRSCRNCGAITNIHIDSIKEEGKCNHCGGELYQRDDDKPEIIRKRWLVYQNQTEPLINYYRNKSLLLKVSGIGTIKEVTNSILLELE